MNKGDVVKNYKVGMVLKNQEDIKDRCWVILSVNRDDINKLDLDVEYPGLYAFTNMSKGIDPYSISSFSEVKSTDNEIFTFIDNDVNGYKVKKLKRIFN